MVGQLLLEAGADIDSADNEGGDSFGRHLDVGFAVGDGHFARPAVVTPYLGRKTFSGEHRQQFRIERNYGRDRTGALVRESHKQLSIAAGREVIQLHVGAAEQMAGHPEPDIFPAVEASGRLP